MAADAQDTERATIPADLLVITGLQGQLDALRGRGLFAVRVAFFSVAAALIPSTGALLAEGRRTAWIVVCIVDAVLSLTCHLDYRAHGKMLAALGWNGRDVGEGLSFDLVRDQVRRADRTLAATWWWQRRLPRASAVVLGVGVLFLVAELVCKVVARLR